MQREDPEDRQGDLQEVDRDERASRDGVDGRQDVRVERRLEEDLGADPVAGDDLLSPPVVLLAVHRQLGEKRLVHHGREMRKAKGECRREDHGEDPRAGHGAVHVERIARATVVNLQRETRSAGVSSVARSCTSRMREGSPGRRPR